MLKAIMSLKRFGLQVQQSRSALATNPPIDRARCEQLLAPMCLGHPSQGAFKTIALICLVTLSGMLVHLPWLDERAFPLVWIGLALWIAVTWRQPRHIAFRLWLWGGFVGLAMVYHWLPSMTARHLEVGGLTGLQVAILVVLWDAFRFGVFGYVIAWIQESRPNSLLIWPIVWVALEWIWPHIIPWRLGHTQIGWLSLCQIAEVTGVYGISFIVMWSAACLATLARAGLKLEANEAIHHRWKITLCGLAVLTCCLWGKCRIRQIEGQRQASPSLRVALVQPGNTENTLESLRNQSLMVDGEVDLIAWGESTIGSFAEELTSFQSIDQTAKYSRFPVSDARPCPGLQCALLCGGGTFAVGQKQTGPFYNTAYLIAHDGRILNRYHKRLLMPWGEYAAGQQWVPGLTDLLSHRDRMIAGKLSAPLTLPDGTQLGVLICYEDLQPQAVRKTVIDGAEILINLNNHILFGRTLAVRQHEKIARFRAIECRRDLLRCGRTGLSSHISATGEVLEQASLNDVGCLLVTARRLQTRTIFTHLFLGS